MGSVFRSSLSTCFYGDQRANQPPWLRTELKAADGGGRACLTHEEISHALTRVLPCPHSHTHTHIHKSSVCSPQHVTKRLLLWAAADASVWCSCDVTGHERGSVSLSAAWMSECTRSRHTSTRRAAAMAHRLGMMWVNDSICSSSLAHCFYHSAPVLNCVLCGGFLMGLQVCVCDDRHNDGEAVVVMKWAGCAAVVNDSDSAVFEVFSCVIQNMRSSVCVCVCLAGADVHYDAISQSHALEQNVLL